MKTRSLILIFALTLINQPPAVAAEKPVNEIFTASKVDVDLTDSNLRIDFEAIFSHPYGISDTTTTLTLTNSGTNTISTLLLRSDNPVNFKSTKVTFRGYLTIPRSFTEGVYTYSLDGVTSNLASGLRIPSGTIAGPILRNVKGAESGILVRNNGNLNLNYATLNGPSYGNQTGNSYIDTGKYLSAPTPIWKVGETFDPKNYFEPSVPGIELSIETSTSNICSSNGKLMQFIAVGDCSFTVSTPKTNNYQPKTIYQSQAITTARKKQNLFIPEVPKQNVVNLPINIILPNVYSSGINAFEYVIPISITPDICEVNVYALKIISGGICKLSYLAKGNQDFLPSETYTQTIEIEKKPQNIFLTIPNFVNLSLKKLTLNAVASSGDMISYETSTNSTCYVVGSTLYLLKRGNCLVSALQSGNKFFSAVSVTSNITIEGAPEQPKVGLSCKKNFRIQNSIKSKSICIKK